MSSIPLSLQILLGYLLIINITAFIAMGHDKHKAIRRAFRTPEFVLFLLAILGGSIGSLLGMSVFHHKTRKWKFRIGMPCILILQIALCIALVHYAGEITFL